MKYFEKQQIYNYKIQQFDSISELVNYLDTAPYNKLFQNIKKRSQLIDEKRNGWAGTESYEEAYELLTKGWSPVAEKLAERVPVKTVPEFVKNTRPAYNVVGHQASVPRYLQGIPTNMIDRKPDVKKQKIIILNRDITFDCSWSQEQIEREGVKTLRIIQSLEGLGYRVKLNMYFLSTSGKDAAVCSVCVKKPEERLSLIKVAFPLAHTSMLRRIMFRFIEKHPTIIDFGYTRNYGYPKGELLKHLVGKGEFLVPNRIENVKEFIQSVLV